MAYTPQPAPAHRPSGVVQPMLDGRGNPYPEFLRAQQVSLSVVKAVADRIDEALGGGPIRLATVTIAASGKAHFRQYLLRSLFPELFGDPLPLRVKAIPQIVSKKATSLIARRLSQAFDPPGGTLHLPGLTLTQDDLFHLLTAVHEGVFGDEPQEEDEPSVTPAAPAVNPPAIPAVPAPAAPAGDSDLMSVLP